MTPSSVHTREIKPQLDKPFPPTIQAYSHLLKLLQKEGAEDLADKLSGCLDEVWLRCSCCQTERWVPKGCRKRWCPLCCPKISAKRLARLGDIQGLMQWPLFVTLTLRPCKLLSETEQVSLLKKHLTTLRRAKLWSTTVEGGVGAIEVTRENKTWHWHWHGLVDCEWLALNSRPPRRRDSAQTVKALCKAAQKELSEEWESITGDSRVVWVQRAGFTTAREVLKYSVAPTSITMCKKGIADVCRAIDSGKLMSRFGTMRGIELPDPEKEPLQCPVCNEAGTTHVTGPIQPSSKWQDPFAASLERRAYIANEREVRIRMARDDIPF